LPIATNSLAVKEPAVLQVTPGRPATILVVGDDPLIAMITVSMLEELGHIALQANSGKEALDLLRGENAVDLVITDQAMPKMRGVQLAEAIAHERPNMPIISEFPSLR
jgi:CheY-like chemotaxis protein